MALTSDECAELRATLRSKATNHRCSDVERWLQKAGFDPPRRPEGSHRVWVHPSGRRVLIVDKGHGPILPVYVKKAIRTILEVGACPD